MATEKDLKEEKTKDTEQKKEELAKTFGLSLKDIEHFKLDNGHEFFKFKDPKDQTFRIIEHRDYNTSMNDSFKSTQDNLESAKTSDASNNARSIYDYNVKNKNIELKLVTITDIKNDEFKYRKKFRELPTRIFKKVQLLIKSHKQLNLRYINIDYGFGINEDGVVIDCNLDFVKGTANFKSAEVVKYDDKEITVDDNNIVVTFSDAELDAICDNLTVVDDLPIVENAKDIEIKGERINTGIIAEGYKDNNVLANNNITQSQRNIYMAIVKHLAKRLAKNKEKTKPIQYVLKYNENRAA